jgi:aminocarboxymuconate-semialdehyde decarboxylase
MIGAPPGLEFIGCGIDGAAPELRHGSGGGRRRHVTVNGRRTVTVDVHAHCIIPGTREIVDAKLAFPPKPMTLVSHERLREMDEQGVDYQALSINPFWYEAPVELATQVVNINNERLAEFCAAHPDRFVAFASVALQEPQIAAVQLEHAVKNLGLRGTAVGAHVGSKEFSDPAFHPFWAKAEELGAVIFIHPTNMPEFKRLKGNGALASVIGNPLDTTIALSHLIFEGTLDRFPGLKICAAHGGGYLPSYVGRSDHGMRVFPDRCDPSIVLKKAPTEYLRGMYFDSLVMNTEGLRHLVEVVGASQVLMGSDHPSGWTTEQVDHVLSTPGLSDDDRIAILGRNAARLLGISHVEPAKQATTAI